MGKIRERKGSERRREKERDRDIHVHPLFMKREIEEIEEREMKRKTVKGINWAGYDRERERERGREKTESEIYR
jgi:hypothetical protein